MSTTVIGLEEKPSISEVAAVQKDRFTVLAGDLSMNYPGFCVMNLKKVNGSWRITGLKVSSIKRSHKDETHGEALVTIGKHLQELFGHEMPNFLVREKALVGQRNGFTPQNQMAIFKVVGVIDILTTIWWRKFTENDRQYRSRQWSEIAATTVKKLITGQGKADKNEVAEGVMKYLKLYCDVDIGDEPFNNDNESDATAVALAWLLSKGVITPIKEEENLKCG